MAEPPAEVRGRIFISYRREDAAYPAGWLFDRLAERFGDEQIFKDVDSIELGDDFVEVISEAVGASDVLLALIGDRWLSVADEEGGRRLDDPTDFVRIEIEAALQRKVRVIPILVAGARMPREEQLPPSLAPLARRQALELSPARFGSDTSRLLRFLETALDPGATTAVIPPPSPAPPPSPPVEEKSEAEAAPPAPPPPSPPVEKEPAATPRPAVERSPARTRSISVGLALAGAALGLFANVMPGEPKLGSDQAYAPETLAVPILVAVTAVLLQTGRLDDRLLYGALLGFGALTTTGAVGIWWVSNKLTLNHGSAALAFFVAGALVLAAGLLGAGRDVRAAASWGTPFRRGPASLLAALGAAVGVAALVVPFGTTTDGIQATVIDAASADFAIALEPIVAVVAAAVAVYALGKSGAIRLLAAGLALAIGVQTMLFYGSLIGAVSYEEFWKPGIGAGIYIGIAAGALLVAAGLVGRRMPKPS